MSATQVIVLVSLLCRVYGAPEAKMQCVVRMESDYNASAINGVHYGAAQFRWTDDETSTWDWMAGMAIQDELFLHGYLLENGPTDPVAALALMMWAVKNGYIDHWEAASFCEGE